MTIKTGLTLCICLTLWLSAIGAWGFSTHSAGVARHFSATECATGSQIVVTCLFTNGEASVLRGLCLADHIPSGLSATTLSVRIDGVDVWNYTAELGSDGDVYTNCTPYRWILEQPTNFLESNSIPSVTGTVQIIYAISSSVSGTFDFKEFSWEGYYQNTAAAAFGYSETNDAQRVVFADNIVSATQTCNGYRPPATGVVVECSFTYPSNRALATFSWTPVLPVGWTLVCAAGQGSPMAAGADVQFSGPFTNNPLRFCYTVTIPGNQPTTNELQGVVHFRFAGLDDTATVAATPARLLVPRYHSADYAEPLWQIDGTEVNRVLAYWRAGGYYREPLGCDGYAPTSTPNIDGPTSGLHSADYEAPYWVVDGSELNRVLAYWRAGGYRLNAAGADGYAPADVPVEGQAGAKQSALGGQLDVVSFLPATYSPGGAFPVTNVLSFSGEMNALGWRPVLPCGWQLVSAEGDGNPECRRGEVIWTAGVLPASPIHMVYWVAVPLWELGERAIAGEALYHAAGMINAAQQSFGPTVPSLTPLDSDADGIPDGWEEHYTGSPTGMVAWADDDRDGLANVLECIAGTDPHDTNSVLSIISVNGCAAGDQILEWRSATNRVYAVDRGTNLLHVSVPVATNLPATPPCNVYTDRPPADAPAFYRIRVEASR